MFRRFSVNFAIFSIAYDAVWIMASLGIATYYRPLLNQYDFAKTVETGSSTPWPVYPAFALIWILVLLQFSVYDGRKNLKALDEFSSLTFGALLASIASAGLLYLTFRDVSRLLFLAFDGIAYFGLILWRGLFRLALRFRKFEPSSRKVLIIGAGEIGQQTYRQLNAHAQFGLKFMGYLDDEVDIPEVIGYLDDAREVVSEKHVDDVVIALPRRAYQKVNQLVAGLHDLPVRVWVIPDYFSLVLHRAVVEEYAGIPMLDLRAPALNEYQRMIKRVFDLVVVVLVMPISLVLLVLSSLAVLVFDGRPVFFIQERVGENGKIFGVYKFRTMIVGADKQLTEEGKDQDLNRINHKRPDDPRVTNIGKFLRRTSLDELPNLINVIRGDMSLVGPRPELPLLVEKYESWQRKRFTMPPGMTGWWQVTGRSDKPMHLNTEDDLYYIQHYSLGLDLLILWKTIWVVLRGKGAY